MLKTIKEIEIDEIFSKSTKGILRTAKKIKEQEPELKYSKRWFKSKHGKNFVTQIKELEKLNWELFSLTFPQKRLFEAIRDMVKNKNFRAELEKIEHEPETEEDKFFKELFDKHGTKLFDYFAKNMEVTQLIPKKRLLSYSATSALSLYAYVDNYCFSVIESLLKNPVTRDHLILKLEKERKIFIDRKIIDEHKTLFDAIRKEFPTNPLDKLKKIMQYFGVNYKISRLRSNLSLAQYYELCDGFTRIRHKLAHRIPVLKPELVEQTSKAVHKNILNFSKSLVKTMSFEDEFPDYTKSIQRLITYWGKGLLFPVSAMYTFIHSSVVSLAIYDQVLGELISIK